VAPFRAVIPQTSNVSCPFLRGGFSLKVGLGEQVLRHGYCVSIYNVLLAKGRSLHSDVFNCKQL
jgi:hypothetical protein